MTEPTLTVALPEKTYAERVAHQLEVTFRSGRTYVVIGLGLLWEVFKTAVPEASQVKFLEALPLLKGQGPTILLIGSYLYASIKPSSALSAQTKEMLAQLARVQLENLMLKQGIQPVPRPEPATGHMVTSDAEPVVVPANVPSPGLERHVPEEPPFARFVRVAKEVDPLITDETILALWKARIG